MSPSPELLPQFLGGPRLAPLAVQAIVCSVFLQRMNKHYK
jgi:hypothetical protein